MPSPATVQPSPKTSTLASVVHCIDDEIIAWLKRREQRRRGKTVSAANKYPRQPVLFWQVLSQ